MRENRSQSRGTNKKRSARPGNSKQNGRLKRTAGGRQSRTSASAGRRSGRGAGGRVSRSRSARPQGGGSLCRKKKGFLIFLGILAIVVAGGLIQNLFLYRAESQVDPNEPYPVKGVDVSEHQKDIDWKGLASEDISFAFIKATEGSSYVDKRFEENWKHANRTDLKVGAYHFMSYDTPGKSQAENFIKQVHWRFGMLPPVVDVEFYGDYISSHPKKSQMYDVLDVILDEFEAKYGRRPIIYTNTYIYKNYISGRYDDYPIWISDPGLSEKLPDGREWTFCQYTFKAKSKYIADGKKYVDMNVFNGSRWEFRKYDGK